MMIMPLRSGKLKGSLEIPRTMLPHRLFCEQGDLGLGQQLVVQIRVVVENDLKFRPRIRFSGHAVPNTSASCGKYYTGLPWSMEIFFGGRIRRMAGKFNEKMDSSRPGEMIQ
jgi:hypothetical protein